MGKVDGDVEPGTGLSRFCKYSKDERDRIGSITRALFESHEKQRDNPLLRYGVRLYKLEKPGPEDRRKLDLIEWILQPTSVTAREYVRRPDGEWMKVGGAVDRWYQTRAHREQAYTSFSKRNVACARIARLGTLRDSTYEELPNG